MWQGAAPSCSKARRWSFAGKDWANDSRLLTCWCSARGPIGNVLRYRQRAARDKVLDVLGDLSLFGADLCGHVVAYRSGHPLNVQLVQTLAGRVEPSRRALLSDRSVIPEDRRQRTEDSKNRSVFCLCLLSSVPLRSRGCNR